MLLEANSPFVACGTSFAARARMDHRWDESLRQTNAERIERERYGSREVDEDEVRRRDARIMAARSVRPGLSPWEIGSRHWNQRDLYTRNARIDDGGYGSGPRVHPDIGSYAYPRHDHRDDSLQVEGPSIYEREAWPWLNYDPNATPLTPERPGLLDRVKGFFRGGHSGKGPKNWRRADATIREDVCEALAWRPDVDASDIEVTVEQGEVTLEGTVRDRHEKRMAEEAAEGVRGVTDVHNRLKLRKDDGDDKDISFVTPVIAM